MFSSKEKVKVGVIGVGVLGRFHTKLYKENAGAELVGVYDVSPAAAKAVGKEFGVKPFESISEHTTGDLPILAVGGVFPQRPFRPTSSPTTTWAEQQVSDEFPAVQTHLILVAATSAAGRMGEVANGRFAAFNFKNSGFG